MFESCYDTDWGLYVVTDPRSYVLLNKKTGEHRAVCKNNPNATLYTALDVAEILIEQRLKSGG